MPESPLSATEIDDLLSVFGGAKKAAGDGVESLDLDRPNRIPKGIFETLQIRHEQAVRTIRPALRTALGSNIELQLKEISQELFQSFRDRQEEPCCAFVFDMKPLRNPAYLVVDFPFLFACIDRLLGGDGNPEGEGRDLTTTEIAIMSDVLTPIMEATVGVWERYMKLTPVLRRSVSVPRFMREVRFSDAVLVADYEVSEFVSGSGFRLAMPLPGLEGLLQYRRKEPETSEEPSGKTEVRAEIQQHMNRVGLGLQVRLGEASVTVGDVTALEEGDVIVLNRRLGQPLDLLLEGHAKFSGRLLREVRAWCSESTGSQVRNQGRAMSDEEVKEPEETPVAADESSEDAETATVTVNPVAFDEMLENSEVEVGPVAGNLNLIMDVDVPVSVVLGTVRKSIGEILSLTEGQVIDLERPAGEPVDLLVNGKLVARGEVVVVDEHYGIRVAQIVTPRA